MKRVLRLTILGSVLGAVLLILSMASGTDASVLPTKYIYATNHQAHQISKINVRTGTYSQVGITNTLGNPDSVAFLTGNIAIVSSSDSFGNGLNTGLMQVNLKTGASSWYTQNLGIFGPFDIALRPGKKSVLMSVRDVIPRSDCSSSAAVLEYHFATNTITTFTVASKLGLQYNGDFDPNGILFTPDHKLYIGTRATQCLGATGGRYIPGALFQVNPYTGNVIKRWPIESDGLTYDPISKKIYIGDVDRVYSFDPTTGITATLASGFVNDTHNGVDGVEIDPHGTLFVADVCEIGCDTSQAGVWEVNTGTGVKKQVAVPVPGISWDDIAPLVGYSAPPTFTPTPTPSPTPTPAADVPWSTFGFDATRSRYNASEHVISTSNVSLLAPRWAASTNSQILASPAISGSRVVIGLMRHSINAYAAITGHPLWNYNPGVPVASSPTIYDTSVYVGARDGVLYALDVSNGAVLWTYQADSAIDDSPAVDNQAVYFGTILGTAYALDRHTGALRWSWQAQNANAFQASPAVANNRVYFPSYNGNLYAINATTGKPTCLYASQNVLQSSPAVANGAVYFAGVQGTVYAINASDCTLLWNYSTGNSVVSSPAVANGLVYAGTDGGALYALDASTGVLHWSYQTGGPVASSPAVANGIVYFASWDKNLYAVDSTQGTLLWSYPTNRYVSSSPGITGGMLFVGANDGTLYGFSQQ